jgi:hypothetical protein
MFELSPRTLGTNNRCIPSSNLLSAGFSQPPMDEFLSLSPPTNLSSPESRCTDKLSVLDTGACLCAVVGQLPLVPRLSSAK